MAISGDRDAEFREIQQRNIVKFRTQTYAARSTPQQALTVRANANSLVAVDAKVAAALGLEGIGPTDPAAVMAQQKSLAKGDRGLFNSIKGAVASPLRHALRAAKAVADPVSRGIKPVIRGGMVGLESAVQAGTGVMRNVATLPGRVGEMAAGAMAGAATGAAVGGAASVMFGGIGAVPGAVFGGVVGAGAGLMGPEVEGEFVNPLSQTTLGQTVAARARGERVDLGTGFFAGGEIRERQIAMARKAASIQGQALTPGRMLASRVFEPESTEFNLMSGLVDAATVIKFDPANAGLKVAGQANLARRTVGGLANPQLNKAIWLRRQAGVVPAEHNTILTDRAREFINTDPRVAQVVKNIATEGDAWKIREMLKGQITSAMATRLAKTTDDAEVRRILEDQVVNGPLTDKRALRGRAATTQATADMAARIIPARVGKPVGQALDRFFAELPGEKINFAGMEDQPRILDRAVTQQDGLLKQAGVDEATRSALNSKLMAAQSAPEARRALTENVASVFKTKLAAVGGSQRVQGKVDDFIKSLDEDLRTLVQDEIVEGASPLIMLREGEGTAQNLDGILEQLPDVNDLRPLAKSKTMAELADPVVTLPNPRDMRRLLTPNQSLREVMAHPLYEGSVAVLDFTMGQLWKPAALLRGAWTVRVIGDEQMRIGASGYDAPIAHPLQLIAMLVRKDRRAVNAAGFMDDPLKESREMNEALATARSMGLENRVKPYALKGKTIIDSRHPDYPVSWASETLALHADEITRKVATDGVDATRRWLYDGEGRPLLERLINASGDNRYLRREYTDAYVFGLADRIKQVTGQSEEMLDVIRTGRINGKLLKSEKPGEFLNQETLADFQRLVDDPTFNNPRQVARSAKLSDDPNRAKMFDRALQASFNFLMTTVVLSGVLPPRCCSSKSRSETRIRSTLACVLSDCCPSERAACNCLSSLPCSSRNASERARCGRRKSR